MTRRIKLVLGDCFNDRGSAPIIYGQVNGRCFYKVSCESFTNNPALQKHSRSSKLGRRGLAKIKLPTGTAHVYSNYALETSPAGHF